MRYSRWAAILAGIAAPLLDTIRRWDTWREYPPALFDDYVLGALLFWVVWITRAEDAKARVRLAAVWGFASGVALMSFGGQMYGVMQGQPDPSGLPSSWVAAIKALMTLYCLAALVAVLREPRSV